MILSFEAEVLICRVVPPRTLLVLRSSNSRRFPTLSFEAEETSWPLAPPGWWLLLGRVKVQRTVAFDSDGCHCGRPARLSASTEAHVKLLICDRAEAKLQNPLTSVCRLQLKNRAVTRAKRRNLIIASTVDPEFRENAAGDGGLGRPI
jgi:hypothetical protein